MRKIVFIFVFLGLFWINPVFAQNSITIKAYENGELLNERDFWDVVEYEGRWRWPHTTKLNGFPGKWIERSEWASAYSMELPVIESLAGPVIFHCVWEVKDFGTIFLDADNEGKGFTNEEINLNYEFARTRFRMLSDDYKKSIKKGFIFSKEIQKELKQSENLLKKAEAAENDSQKANLADQALEVLMWASEDFALEKADQDIESYRKTDFKIQVVDENGKKISGEVFYNLKVHNFDFGVYSVQQEEKLKQLADAGFTLNCVHLPWNRSHPKEGEIAWDLMDYELKDKLKEEDNEEFDEEISDSKKFIFDKTMFLHLWGENDPVHWFDNYSQDKLNKTVKDHCEQIVERYKNEVDIWEFEWIHSIESSKGFSRADHNRFLKTAYDVVRSLDPSADIGVSILRPDHYFNHYYIDSSGEEPRYKEDNFFKDPYELLIELEDIGVDIDRIQFLHIDYGGFDVHPEKGGDEPSAQNPMRDLYSLAKVVEPYSFFKKDIAMEFLRIPSDDFKGNVYWWHKDWSEDLQSEWLTGYIKIMYSLPYIRGVSLINPAAEDGAEEDDFSTEKIFDVKTGKAKKAYFDIKKLLTEEWHTQGETKIDNNGKIDFRGFEGEYEIQVKGYEPALVNLTKEKLYSKVTLEKKSIGSLVPDNFKIIISAIIAIIFFGVVYVAYLKPRKR